MAKPIRLVVHGLVRSTTCEPRAGATLEIYHANADGWYGPGGGDACCYYQGFLVTDAEGRFTFETVKPGPYHDVVPPPAAHLHVKADDPGMNGISIELPFLGDPALPLPAPPTALQLTPDSDANGSFLRADLTITLSSR